MTLPSDLSMFIAVILGALIGHIANRPPRVGICRCGHDSCYHSFGTGNCFTLDCHCMKFHFSHSYPKKEAKNG